MKVRLAAIATLAPISTPNHTTTSGASAILGTPLIATMIGLRMRATVSDSHRASPVTLPSVVPTTKPRIASKAVAPAWVNNSPLAVSAISFCRIPEGWP